MNLKTLQKYKYTIPVIAILLVIALGVGLISVSENLTKEKETPLTPTYVGGVSKSTDTLKPNWSLINIGASTQEIEKIMGKPSRTETKNNQIIYIYVPNATTPLATHDITFENGKVVKIKRSIDSFYDTVLIDTYVQKYGQPTILRQQLGPDTYALFAFKINEDQYVVTEVDKQNNSIYNIYVLNKNSFTAFAEESKKAPAPVQDDFEVQPL